MENDQILASVKFRLAEPSYAEALRLIGHEISKFDLNYPEILYADNKFLLRDHHLRSSHASSSRDLTPPSKNRISRLLANTPRKGSVPSPMKVFDREYTPEKIERMSRDLKMKREPRKPIGRSTKVSDFYSLSEVFRTMGAILDAEGAHLRKIRKEDQGFVVEFSDRTGRELVKRYTLQALQKKHAEMFCDRRNRGEEDPWAHAL